MQDRTPTKTTGTNKGMLRFAGYVTPDPSCGSEEAGEVRRRQWMGLKERRRKTFESRCAEVDRVEGTAS